MVRAARFKLVLVMAVISNFISFSTEYGSGESPGSETVGFGRVRGVGKGERMDAGEADAGGII